MLARPRRRASRPTSARTTTPASRAGRPSDHRCVVHPGWPGPGDDPHPPRIAGLARHVPHPGRLCQAGRHRERDERRTHRDGHWRGLERGRARPAGIPFPDLGDRYDRLEEAVELIHGLWTRPTAGPSGPALAGGRGSLRSSACPARPPHPPIILGGRGGPRLVRLAARFADELKSSRPRRSGPARPIARLDRACSDAGRDPASHAFGHDGRVAGRDGGRPA